MFDCDCTQHLRFDLWACGPRTGSVYGADSVQVPTAPSKQPTVRSRSRKLPDTRGAPTAPSGGGASGAAKLRGSGDPDNDEPGNEKKNKKLAKLELSEPVTTFLPTRGDRKSLPYAILTEIYYHRENVEKERLLFPRIHAYYVNNPYLQRVQAIVQRPKDDIANNDGLSADCDTIYDVICGKSKKRRRVLFERSSTTPSSTEQPSARSPRVHHSVGAPLALPRSPRTNNREETDMDAWSAVISLRKLDAVVCKKKIRGVHDRENYPFHNLCYFLESKLPETFRNASHERTLRESCKTDVEEGRMTLDRQYIPFNMLASYHNMLHHHQKRYFDGFRRRQKVQMQTQAKGAFMTSYCQLNFFIWPYEFQLWSHIPEIRALVQKYVELERVRKCKGSLTEEENQKARDDARQFYLYDYPQHIAVPQLPANLASIPKLTLSEELEETLLRRSYIYETIPLTTFIPNSNLRHQTIAIQPKLPHLIPVS